VSSANRWLLGTFTGLIGAVLLTLWLVRPTFDLTYYLPEPTSEAEAVLAERLGQGAGARLIFAEIERSAADAAEVAARMKQSLADSPLFNRVESGEAELALESIPAPLWRGRYLLADTDWSEAAIRTALQQRLADLSLMGSSEFSRLIAADPTWATPQILERMRFGGADWQPNWSDGENRAFLVLETVAAPFDFAAQQNAVHALRAAYRAAAGTDAGLGLYGVGVYSTQISSRVQSESQWLGIGASLLVLCVVFLAYRSWRLMLICLVPLASAILGGLVVSTLVFGAIHGITIAFGATLVGVVDDYPMHLFSHSRHASARAGVRRLFVTLLASAGTAIAAYSALALSGSRGLAQLGVFSLSGVLCAMLVTCLLLPRLMTDAAPVSAEEERAQQFTLSARVWLPATAVALVLVVLSGGVRWNDNPGELTPLPAALLARDHAMRERFGAPDPRFLVSVQAESVEQVLQRTESLNALLGEARAQGLIQSWSTVTTVLPSEAAQRRRQQVIPAAQTLRAVVSAAVRDLPFKSDALAPFLAAAEAARTQVPLTPQNLSDALLGDYVNSHLAPGGAGWRSFIYITGLDSPTQFATWLAARDRGALLVDLKSAAESLMRSYRLRLFGVLGLALVVIAGIVLWATRTLRRFLWCLGTVAAAVLVTVIAVTLLHGKITLFHLVSLVLVAGLGVDYCLFYSRPDVSRTEFLDAGHALLACAASTVGGFAILAASSIPMLSAIGTTVAIGTSTMYVMARVGCRPQ
jgi:predicted exporter